ncbi:CACNA1S [Symbiodinium natans]|uniref:CACNA1S protein n=1 Tax=Symbiodinium natans TaxID=878477 RepID=A0A812V0E0_9DINO|nr:CACNA1S [Symbiodinium natans]
MFFVAFFLDLVMRWVADGFVYFICSEEMHWNLLDVFVVAIGCMEVVTETLVMAGSETGLLLTNFSVVRMIRVLRVVRIARVIRVLKAFRELRLMVASIVSSARNLLWVTLVLCVMLYVFGISFTSAVTMELESLPKNAEGTEDLKKYFGSLSSSILTLYSSMSGGEDWTVYFHVLADKLPWPYPSLFLFFVTFAVFAVVNVVTGVFVDTAIEKNQSDKELAVQEELRNKRLRMNWIRDVFSELDSSGDGTVTQEEFESQLNHEAVIAYFNTLKLDVSDAKTLFRMLDSDGSEGVNIDEFVSGCYRLSGEATTLHTQVRSNHEENRQISCDEAVYCL